MSQAEPTAADGGNPPVERTIPIYEERAVVDKDVVTTGRVRVTTHTKLVEEIAAATLQGESVEVERVAVDRPVSGELPGVRTEGDVTIVPVFEEVLVVEKRLVLKEEIHIRRRATQESVSIPVELRRQEVAVERSAEGEAGA